MFNVKQFTVGDEIIGNFYPVSDDGGKSSFMLTIDALSGYNIDMKAGLIADIIVAILIIVNLIICTHKGFIRCVISSVSSILAFVVAILTAAPLANTFQDKFDWETKVANWHVPFISAHTLLCLLVGIGVFIVIRLLCILLDKLLQLVKQKLKAVNVIDRILGTVFGLFAALVELTFIFMLIDQLGWTANLSLTADAGGFFAYRVFDFCHDYLFDIFSKVASAASENNIV